MGQNRDVSRGWNAVPQPLADVTVSDETLPNALRRPMVAKDGA
jgi:hypothetical protein